MMGDGRQSSVQSGRAGQHEIDSRETRDHVEPQLGDLAMKRADPANWRTTPPGHHGSLPVSSMARSGQSERDQTVDSCEFADMNKRISGRG